MRNQGVDTIHQAPAYSEDGADLMRTRWMLSLPPTERLQHLQHSITMLLKLRRARTLD